MYVCSEANNSDVTVNQLAVLKYDISSSNSTLSATVTWLITDFPNALENQGFEGITWIPDSFLQANNFYDNNMKKTYNPSDYPNHGTGLFMLGLEGRWVDRDS